METQEIKNALLACTKAVIDSLELIATEKLPKDCIDMIKDRLTKELAPRKYQMLTTADMYNAIRDFKPHPPPPDCPLEKIEVSYATFMQLREMLSPLTDHRLYGGVYFLCCDYKVVINPMVALGVFKYGDNIIPFKSKSYE